MKKFSLITLAFLLFALQNAAVTAQTVEADKAVQAVEAYIKTIDAFVAKEGGPHLVIARVGDYNDEDSLVWKKFDSEEEFENAEVESYETAYVWKKEGKVVRVNVTYSSPSGDWVEYFLQTYREDGTLAYVDRELRTFLGDIIVNHIRIFDENGKRLTETKRFRDLNTDKEIKEEDAEYMNVEAGEAYMKIGDFPFAGLFDKKKKAGK
jgi:hypothetical protein